MKKLKLGIFLLFICNFLPAQKPQFQWVKHMDGKENSCDIGKAITLDSVGNIYTVGVFSSTNDFDPGPGVFNMTGTGLENYWDIFILKLDASGNFVWAKQLGGDYLDIANAIALDGDGNICITGYFEGAVDFDPGKGEFNLTADNKLYHGDVFVVKLNNDGDFIWAKQIGGLQQKESFAIAVDSLGSIYTTGVFKGNLDFNPDTGQFNLTSNGEKDIFILKLSVEGQFLWAKSFGGKLDDYVSSVAVDLKGNIITTGSFQELVDFDSDILDSFNLTSFGMGDIFVLKMDNNGNFIWVKRVGGISWDAGNAIAIDSKQSLYLTGSFVKHADFNPGMAVYDLFSSSGFNNTFILKLDEYGNFVWAKNFEGTTVGAGFDIAVDGFGSVYTTGYFQETVDFDPGLKVYNLTVTPSIGNDDVFISKLDGLGQFVWAKKMGGMYSDIGYSVATDVVGNVFTTGSFGGTADFDPGDGICFLTSKGCTDVFIHKIDTSVKYIPVISTIEYLNIYPNPTDGLLKVVFPQQENQVNILLYNAIGELVYTKDTFDDVNKIDLSGFAFGLYIVKIMSCGNLLAIKKIIKI